MSGPATTITLTLDSLDSLLVEPNENGPWGPLTPSGIGEILSRLWSVPDGRPVDIFIRLPREQLTGGGEQRAREALDRYCHERLEEHNWTAAAARQEAMKRLFNGIFLAAVLLAAAIVATLAFRPGELGQTLMVGAALGIGWVFLLRPQRDYVTRALSLRRESVACARLREARVMIEPV